MGAVIRDRRRYEYLACWKCLRTYAATYEHRCPHCGAPQPHVEVEPKGRERG